MLITNARLYTPAGCLREGWLQFRGSRIIGIGAGQPPLDDEIIDAGGLNLLPGFIDLHMHGAMGYDVMDATPEALAEIEAYCIRHGVTGLLPTTLTNTHEHIMAAIQNVGAWMSRADNPISLGVHLEGPYLNVKKTGAQNPQYIRLANEAELDDLLRPNLIRLATVAPEFEANHLLIQRCVEAGVRVSVAHSSATYEMMQRAFSLGLSHSTHTFNAQTGFTHREPGIIGAVMSTEHVTCELICDNIHVHPAAMRMLWATKKPHHLILITDAVRPGGMPEGEYLFDERPSMLADGAVRLMDGTLAGSILTMNRALYNFMQATHEPLVNVWQTSSLNPARAIGLSHRKGSLEIGKDADLVLVDDEMNVYMTVVCGTVAYQSEKEAVTK